MNVDANDLTDKVTVHAVGVGAEPGRASVRLDRIRERFEVVPLDAVVHEPVAVIKIDVEGMEEQVLKGAERILREHHPVVFAEAREDTERAAIEALLATHGYRPTGRVFNSSPTYEFVVSSHKEWIRRAAPRLAKWTRRILSRVRHATRSH
jgi:hypothetical protein